VSTLDLVAIAFIVWFAGAVPIALILGRVFSLNQEQEAGRTRTGTRTRIASRTAHTLVLVQPNDFATGQVGDALRRRRPSFPSSG
jgi:glycerol-3-phosphate acyltransferase PlsY